jgi:endonuclease/exonuclease/phosphatase family metal-dependent hydrolase
MVTVSTFNANNLFVRYRFGSSFPGAPAKAAAAPTPPAPVDPATTASTKFGFLPQYQNASFEVFNAPQRKLAALALTRGGEHPLPDLVVLQEVESLIALRVFNERHLGGHYTQALLVDSRDYRQIDIGVLAGPTVQIQDVRTNVDLLAKPGEEYKPDWPWQFSRDCLEVQTRLPGGQQFTVFVNHFKSKFVQPRKGQTKAEIEAEKKLADGYRLRQARAVIELVHARFPGTRFSEDWFAVTGDFNSLNAEAPALEITAAGLEDAVTRLPAEQRWTEYYAGGGSVGQLDYLFLSPALAAATAGTLPHIERRGIGMREASAVDGRPLPKKVKLEVSDTQAPAATVNFRFDRFGGVTAKAKASDHCPVFFDLP